MMRRALLACGIVSSALYLVTIDVVAPLLYPEYHDYSTQMVSELIAKDAPTRKLAVVAFIPYNVLVFAFAAGVWSSSGTTTTRLTATALIAYGVTSSAGLLVAPMDLKTAGLTGQTILHIAVTILQGVFILLTLTIGAFAAGARFKRFTLFTIVVCVVFGALAGRQASLDSQWIGLTERVNIYAWMVWMAALAVTMWPQKTVRFR
jgi:hypothetical protein